MWGLKTQCDYPGAITLRMFVIPTPLWLALMMILMVAAASGQKIEELPAPPSVEPTSSDCGRKKVGNCKKPRHSATL